MLMQSKHNKLIPNSMTLIGLHADSPQSHWDRLAKDLENPQFKTPEGYPMVAIDYETTQVRNVYRAQYFEIETHEYLRKLDMYQKGKVKSKPTPPSDTKQMPFDILNTMITGVGICANSKRSFYINLGHRQEEGQMPVVPLPRDRNEVHRLKESIRGEQRKFLEYIFSACPNGVMYVAHNANYEYKVSMSNGFDFFWEGSTRYSGGIMCSMLLAKLFNFPSNSLKKLVERIYSFSQPEYLEAIAHTHLPRMIKIYFESIGSKVGENPEFDSRTSILIRNIKFNKKITFESSMDVAYYDSFYVTEVSLKEFQKVLKGLIESVVSSFSDMSDNSLAEVLPYAGQDPWWTLRLAVDLIGRAQGRTTQSKYTTTLWDYYMKVEFPIIQLVADMSHKGMKIDGRKVKELQKNCIIKETEYRLRFRNAAWKTFKSRFPFLFKEKITDWSEFRQDVKAKALQEIRKFKEVSEKPVIPKFIDEFSSVGEVKDFIRRMDALNTGQQKFLFFSVLCFPVWKLTDKGMPSLDKKVLPRYEILGDAAAALLDLRKVSQIYGLYARPYERLVHPDTGKVHGILNQSGADTGRFTMAQPNLQQMSKFAKREVEKNLTVRDLIIAESKDRVLLAPDFSQIELRVMAYISGDKNMMQCYTGDEDGKFIDIHTKTNQFIFSKELSQFEKGTKEYEKNAKFYRRVSKTVNFLSQYGGGPGTLLTGLLAEKMQFNIDDCKRFIDGFYQAYPGVKSYNEQYGGVTVNRSRISLTDFGRPRYISGYDDTEFWKVKGAERQANNHRVQGTAGDIMKITMARIYWSDYLRSLGVRTLLTIHDELVLSIPKKNFAKSIKCIVDAYSNYNFPVPIRTSLDAGLNFGNLTGLTETDDSSIAWDDVPKWCEKVTMVPYTKEDAEANNTFYPTGDEEWLHVEIH